VSWLENDQKSHEEYSTGIVGSGFANGLIALSTMGPTPAWLLIESFFVTLDTVPAGEVRTVVIAQRLDYMRGFAIATLTAMGLVMFNAHGFLSNCHYVLLSREPPTRSPDGHCL
jgi:hypothetical protein